MFNEIRKFIKVCEKDSGNYREGTYMFSIMLDNDGNNSFEATVHVQPKKFFEYINSDSDFEFWYNAYPSGPVHLYAKEKEFKPEVRLVTMLYREVIIEYARKSVKANVFKRLAVMDTEKLFTECVKLGVFGGVLKSGLL